MKHWANEGLVAKDQINKNNLQFIHDKGKCKDSLSVGQEYNTNMSNTEVENGKDSEPGLMRVIS